MEVKLKISRPWNEQALAMPIKSLMWISQRHIVAGEIMGSRDDNADSDGIIVNNLICWNSHQIYVT